MASKLAIPSLLISQRSFYVTPYCRGNNKMFDKELLICQTALSTRWSVTVAIMNHSGGERCRQPQRKNLLTESPKGTQVKRTFVKVTIQNFLDEIIAEPAKGSRLEFRGFGVLEPRDCAPRTAQNPKTLERIHVPAKRTVKFKAGRLMKQERNGQSV